MNGNEQSAAWPGCMAPDGGECCPQYHALERECARHREPIAGRRACQRCGRRDGLDAVVPNAAWRRIRAAAGGADILCLWCIDEIAAGHGVETSAALHFAGRALHASSNVRFAECIEIATRSAIKQRDAARAGEAYLLAALTMLLEQFAKYARTHGDEDIADATAKLKSLLACELQKRNG